MKFKEQIADGILITALLIASMIAVFEVYQLLDGYCRLDRAVEVVNDEPKYALGDIVKFKLEPFYKNCDNTATILSYKNAASGQVLYVMDSVDCVVNSKYNWTLNESQIIKVIGIAK